jgi:hypothetical protein
MSPAEAKKMRDGWRELATDYGKMSMDYQNHHPEKEIPTSLHYSRMKVAIEICADDLDKAYGRL